MHYQHNKCVRDVLSQYIGLTKVIKNAIFFGLFGAYKKPQMTISVML
jgi:hypothetical protein